MFNLLGVIALIAAASAPSPPPTATVILATDALSLCGAYRQYRG